MPHLARAGSLGLDDDIAGRHLLFAALANLPSRTQTCICGCIGSDRGEGLAAVAIANECSNLGLEFAWSAQTVCVDVGAVVLVAGGGTG
jgi:hypothetical protein